MLELVPCFNVAKWKSINQWYVPLRMGIWCFILTMEPWMTSNQNCDCVITANWCFASIRENGRHYPWRHAQSISNSEIGFTLPPYRVQVYKKPMDSFVFTSFYHDTHDNVWHMLIILNPSSTTTRASDILLILSLVFIWFGKRFSEFIHLNQNQESKYSITNNSGMFICF